MSMASTPRTQFLLVGCALAGLGGLLACTTDDNDPGVDASDGSTSSSAGGSTSSSSAETTDGSTSGETSSTGSGGSSSTGTARCAASIALGTSSPGIANFDDYDGATALGEWSFPLGGDTSVGVFAGPFGYGDDHTEGDTQLPEAFEMVDGNGSTYALSISDTESTEYGGGMGLWLSECVNATTFSGISMWIRGNGPTGDAKLSLLMEETTPEADDGTCVGTTDTCIHPSYTFPVTTDWTQVQVAWGDFMAGDAAGTAVTPDGSNIWQIQFDIGLVWEPDDSGEYVPVPAGYELTVDDMTFY